MADKLKNLLLAVLLLLMGVLLVLTFWISARGAGGQFSLLQVKEEPDSTQDVPLSLVQPEVLALLAEKGVHLAESIGGYGLLWQQAEPVFQEAVGSAATPEPLPEAAYRGLLKAPGVLLQYHTALPFYLFQAWGGSEQLWEAPVVQSAALVLEEAGVVLLFTDENGSHWKALTAASAAEIQALCDNAPSVNAVLAGDSRALAADEVLTTRVERFSAVAVSEAEVAVKNEISQTMQSLFGLNPYLTRVYPDADGSLVYVEGHSTVRLSPEGDLVYAGAGIDLELSGTTELETRAEICQKVYDRLRRLWQQAGASGTLCLESQQWSEGGCVLRFGLQLEGVVLERSRGDWATVTVKDGRITGLNASPRLLTARESVQLLPGYQAATVLPQGSARLRVRLLEQADGSMLPQRCRVTED